MQVLGQSCRLSYSRPATTAISLCDRGIPVPGVTGVLWGLQDASFSLVSSPPPSHPAAHIKPWRSQGPTQDISLHLNPFLNW